MNEDSLLSGLKVVSTAILFAGCGALSSSLLLPHFPDRFDFIFPLPFALICTLLFMRNSRAVFAVVLMEIVWLVTFFAAFAVGFVGTGFGLSFLPGMIGGLLGGFGLVLCIMICHPLMVSLKRLSIGGLIGSIVGLAFTSWTRIHMAQHYGDNINRVFPKTVPISAFVIWQAAMGAYLYMISRRPARRHNAEESSDALQAPEQRDPK